MTRTHDSPAVLPGQYVLSALLVLAACLALAMALISPTAKQVHHDEFDHRNAARYYYEHWLPPRVADPDALESYSLYGMSYLNELDVVYLLAGKFAKLVNPITGDDLLSLRLFNVGLFLVLVCVAIASRSRLLALVLLLVSPQLWYIFSYFNADAFPLFISFLTAAALAAPSSIFNQGTRSILVRYSLLSLCIGILVLSKRSFWLFGIFAILYVFWVEFYEQGNGRALAAPFAKAGLLLGLIAVIVAPRLAYDYYINGSPSEKFGQIRKTASRLAASSFKSENRWTFQSKGIGVVEMMGPPYNWADRSAKSTFGAYNYNTIRMSTWYYRFMYLLHAALLLYLISIGILRGGMSVATITTGSVFFAALVLSASVYHSWSADSQPQGRYLFAIFPLMAVVLQRARSVLSLRIVGAFVAVCAVASIYSFFEVGLKNASTFRDIAEINPIFRRVGSASP